MKEYHKIICAVYLLLIRDGKVLLLRRFNTGYEDGNYSLPAGHVDAGESVADALVREAKEETGIVLNKQNIDFVHVMHRRQTSGNDEHVDFFFTCQNYEGEIKNLEPEKCDDLSWFDLDSPPANVIPYVRQAIENVASRKFYSELNW